MLSKKAADCSGDAIKRKAIRLPDSSSLTIDRASDEIGSFAKSEMDKLKVHKALSELHPFSNRSREEVMEFVCYMFELQGNLNETICHPSERNRCFYFVASGQLLHRQAAGKHRPMVERRLLELDCWGLECLCTGRDERICVTVTSSCRLFVLTARRFFWLCRMAAQRTHLMQLGVVERLVNQLHSVEQVLGLSEADAGTIARASASTAVSGEQQPQPQPRVTKLANGSLVNRVNPRLLDGILHSIRQLDVSAHQEDNGKPSVVLSCSTGQTMIVYCLTGCASLQLDHCNNVTSVVALNSATLGPGDSLEIGANQNWKMTNSVGQNNQKHHQQTIVYLIWLRSSETSSESTVE